MQIGKTKFTLSVIGAFLIGVLLTAGVFIGVYAIFGDDDEKNEMYEKYGKIEQLYQTVISGYYTDVDGDVLMEGACKGMVEALGDPYSTYMTSEEYSSWMDSVTGEYSGVGITFTENENGEFVIVSVNDDSPAERAGLKERDILLGADGKTYKNMDMLSNAIKGKAGTKVTVDYKRNGKEHSVTMTREEIIQHSVSHEMLDEDTGYIEITSFIESTAEDFEHALADIEDSGAKELVLDLRDNGGGLLDQCIEIADAFLDAGTIVIMEGNDGEQDIYDAEAGKTDIEAVVLVNENSASAAEILAAALQDHGFTIVGQKTFGKGVIQSTGTLDDGSALKLTIMQYFSPDGNPINKKGVMPDHSVKNQEADTGDEETMKADDAQMEKALELLGE